jgi:hypothetical protein
VTAADPFAVLGLPARPDLTDQQVREAWIAIAAATHPDRPDGGDQAQYADASAAYAQLRTPWQRTEACADLTAGQIPPPVAPATLAHPHLPALAGVLLVPARIRHGRPRRLALRVLAAALLAVLVTYSGAGAPSIAAVLAGVGMWLLLTGRGDLAPPPGR